MGMSFSTADGPQTHERGLLEGLHLDLPLLLGLLFVCGMGMIVLYSASGGDNALLLKQCIRIGIAFSVMVVVAQIPPHALLRWAPWFFLCGIVLLLTVLWLGHTGKGAQRWLDLGFVRFQPSEMMKLVVPMMTAWYLSRAPLPPRFAQLLIASLIILVPVLLIARQPDLGTSLLVACAGGFVLFLSGMSWRLILALGAVLSALAPVIWYRMLDYQKQRVLTFLNPESDPLGSGYHIIQSKIALGSGGLYGKGWMNGTQAQLEFLPERSTDFIFAVLGEEFGLNGILILLAAYLFIVMRGMYLATRAQNTFSRLLAGSLTLTFFVYVFVNTGMVSGLLPVVGVPLPLVSYGGTSIVTLMAGFGILMSIHTHRKLLHA